MNTICNNSISMGTCANYISDVATWGEETISYSGTLSDP